MNFFLRAVILFILLLFIISKTCASDGTHHLSMYDVNQYTNDNGLPQNSVKRIIQDENGYIWLATDGGLVRFDGRSFYNFDLFGDLYQSRSIAAFHNGYDTRDGKRFYAQNDEGGLITIQKGMAIKGAEEHRYAPYKDQFTKEYKNQYVTKGLPDYVQRYPYPDHFIIPTGRESYFVSQKERIQLIEKQNVKREFVFQTEDFWKLFRLGNALFYQNPEGDFYSFNPDDGLKRRVRISRPEHGSQQEKVFSGEDQIIWNNCSDQVFLMSGNDLFYLKIEKGGLLSAVLILSGFHFKENEIRTVFYDQQNERIFLGSLSHGLFVLNKKLFHTYTNPAKGADNVYYAQTPYNNQAVLSSQGFIFDMKKGIMDLTIEKLPLISENSAGDKYSLCTDMHGFIWSKSGSNLFKYDPTGKTLVAQWKLKDEISQLYEGGDGEIWIGTKNTGLYHIRSNERNASPKLYAKGPLLRISWMQHQGKDILWVGTGKGLFKVFLKSHKVAIVKDFTNLYIRSLHIPNTEELWITTYKNGFYLLKDNRFTHFPLDKNEYIANAHCIAEDKKGFFWITTNRGLFRISKNDLLEYARKPFDIYYQYYSKSHGFNINEFNGGCQQCAVRLENGYLSLPSLNGLVLFNPENVREEVSSGKVMFQEVLVNNKTHHFNPHAISLSESPEQLSLKLSTSYISDPYNLKISYALVRKGREATIWLPLDNQDLNIVIGSLSSGDYVLKVRKVKGFGADHYEETLIDIVVEKYWYESVWAIACGMVTTILLIYIIVRQRLRTLERRNILLEKKIADRTGHLEEMLLAIRYSEKELEQQARLHARMIASISHDIQSPVKFLKSSSLSIKKLVLNDEIETAIKASETMAYTSEKLYLLIDSMITFIKSNMYGKSIDSRKVNLLELVKDKTAIFREIIKVHRGSIVMDIDPDVFVNTNAKLMGVVIHNLIDNAIKVKSGNEILITVRNRDGGIKLAVSDKGPGMPAEVLEWLNNPESPEERMTLSSEKHEGLGLVLVKEISQLLRLTLHVQNNNGAEITFMFNP